MPSASCCFLHVFGFLGKQYQTKSKCRKNFWINFFWTKRDPGSFGRRPEDDTREPQATRARPGGRALQACGPLVAPLDLIPAYKFSNIPKPTESHPKHFFRRRKSLFLRDPIWRPFPVLCRRGNRSRRASTSTLLPFR